MQLCTKVEGRRKRLREEDDHGILFSAGSGSRTPTLVCSRRRLVGVNEHQLDHDDDAEHPLKRFKGESGVVTVVASTKAKPSEAKPQSGLLGTLPEDVMSHCLSFLNSVEDRFSLQTTCKQFRRISNSDKMLVKIQVGGDRETGKGGIIQDEDTPETAAVVLAPFSQAGNLEAIYMLGMIKSYCHQDVESGIRLLRSASAKGYVRSSYALGLVLRDSQPEEATKYMKLAAGEGYLPALQELLPAREMKAKYGEPNADELRRHLDPICLNHLLGRHYVHSAELRELNTSHCWNPLCGRWAFKASVNASGAAVRIRRPWGLAFIRNGNGEAQPHGHGAARIHNNGGDTTATGTQNERNNETNYIGRNAPARNESSTGANNDNRTTNAGPRAGPADADTRGDSSGTSDESSPPQPGNQNTNTDSTTSIDVRVSRMKMCSRCCRAKYCSKLCQVYDWRSGRHKMECQFL